MKHIFRFTLFLLPFAFFLSGCAFGKTQPAIVRPKVEEPVNTVPVSERIYTTIDFNKSSKFPTGREVTITITDNKGASQIGYELEAQAGTSVQSGIGSIDTKNVQKPYEKNVLLGSCSAGGACSYYQDVKGGALILRFIGSSIGNLKGEWSYAVPGNDGKLSSRDAKFQLDAPKLKDAYTIISQTMGVPQPTSSDILAGPYHIASTASAMGDISVTIHLSEDSPKATLLFWDGVKYQTLKSSLSGKTLTAKISISGTYLVTK